MANKVNIFLIVFVLSVILTVSGCVKSDKSDFADGDFVSATIGHVVYNLEVARSNDARTTGLSNRENLDDDAGILFVFDNSDYHSFWMKDTHITLEIIWLDENLTIVDKKVMVVENDPANPVASYKPQAPALYAIEIKPIIDIDSVSIGDKVEISY